MGATGSLDRPVPGLIESLRKGSGPHTLVAHTYPEKVRKVEATRQAIQKWLTMAWVGLLVIAGAVGLVQLARQIKNLIEVLVIVAIVGVLIALLIPATTIGQVDVCGPEVPGDQRTEATRACGRDVLTGEPGLARSRFVAGSPRLCSGVLSWSPTTAAPASLEVDLADSITTWRLTASAVTLDGRLGGSRSAIRVFQGFFVDLDPPVAMIPRG